MAIRDGEPIEEVFFTPRPEWYSQKTSSGKPMSSVISLRAERCMFVAALTYCEYFKEDRGCKYCNIVPSEFTKKELGMERIVAKREQDVYETFVAASKEGKIRHVNMSGGVLLDASKEAEVYARVTKALRRAMKDVGYECPIYVACQAMEAQDQMKLREAGVARVGFNLEVWDERLFNVICPEKAKYVGRERWIDRLLQAVEIWRDPWCGFVVGVEMAPPYGFKTEDQAAASNLEGWEWLMAHGAIVTSGIWRCLPGTEFAGMLSRRTAYFLRMELARHKMALKYNRVPRQCNRCTGQNVFFDWAYVAFSGKN